MSYETFPLTPEFSHTQRDDYNTLQTPAETGDVQLRAKWSKPRRFYRLQWHHATADEAEKLKGFARDMVGSATPFYYGPPDNVPRPYSAPTMGQVSGSTESGRGTLYAAFTWSDGSNETTESVNVGSLAVTDFYRLTVTVPIFPTSVDRALVYVGAVSTNLFEQSTAITTSGGTWTEPAGGYATGTDNPPSTNALSETPLVHFMEDSLEVVKISAEYYSMRIEFEELFET